MNETPIRVVLADDHPSVRAGIRQFIERDPGIQVLAEADDGARALQLIRQHRPDVAVLDLQMPKLTGLEVIAEARKEALPTAYMILTAYDDDPYIFAALRAGAKGYLLKTAGPEDLAQAIRRVHAGHSAFDPDVTARIMDQFSAPAPAEQDKLSERELDVLRLASQGLTNRGIGHTLKISERTVHSHLVNVFGKLGVNTRTQAVLKAMRMGLISLDDTASSTDSPRSSG